MKDIDSSLVWSFQYVMFVQYSNMHQSFGQWLQGRTLTSGWGMVERCLRPVLVFYPNSSTA
jgi:hypothetical protein